MLADGADVSDTRMTLKLNRQGVLQTSIRQVGEHRFPNRSIGRG